MNTDCEPDSDLKYADLDLDWLLDCVINSTTSVSRPSGVTINTRCRGGSDTVISK